MNISQITEEFKKKVCKSISIVPEGINRFRVFSPFKFTDGDHLCILLKSTPEGWLLSDEGHTYMHLSYAEDIKYFERGTKQKVINEILSTLGIQEHDGEFRILAKDPELGDSFYSFVQGLIQITDVRYLSREMVRSMFMEYFREFIVKSIPEDKFEFDYFDKKHDPERKYTVDCRINSMQVPLFIYAISNNDKCQNATINLLKFETWNIRSHSLAIFEDQESINRKTLAKFSDVVEKQFSSLATNRDRIRNYVGEMAGISR